MKKIYSHLFTVIYASLALAISACSKSDGSSPTLSMDETPNTKVEIREILEVETDTVGTLAAKIGEKSSVVQKLIINGPIDAVDVRTIHSLPQLLAIDMKNATICGGDSTFTYNKTAYKLYDNEVVRYMYPSQLSEIILPDNLKAINDYAFAITTYNSYPNLTELIIPDNVNKIGEYAFLECKLQYIKLPENLQEIKSYTFSYCSDLNSIEIGSKLKEIGDHAFQVCHNLKTITLPDGLEILGYRCFYSCGLTEIKIPDSVITFKGEDNNDSNEPRDTFNSCSSLKSVILPQNMTEIYNGMFEDCSSLTSITIPETVTVIRDYAFADCTKLSNINFPSKLTGIGGFAFQNNEELKTIVLPEETPLTLGHRAFQGSGLTSLTLPASVTNIGTYCFFDCNRMTTIDLSNSQITSLPAYAFESCDALKEIKLSESLAGLGGSCFAHCSDLETVNIPNSVTGLGSSCFGWCASLKNVTLPKSLQTIGSSAFSSCSALETINIPNAVTTIESSTFNLCTALKNVTLPESLQTIGSSTFSGCSALETINIPDAVTTIENNAFTRCTALKTIKLPEALTTLGYGCFEGCNKLSTITIPANVTSVGTGLISKCYNLTSVFWESSTAIPESFSARYLDDINQNLLLYLSNPNTQVLDPYIKNIVVNGIAEVLVLSSVPNSTFYVPQEFKAIKISYTRNFAYPTYPGEAAGWRSISLPFTVTSITHSDGRVLAPFNANVTGAKPFWLRRLTENGFENVTQIEAGVPYIIAMPNNEAYDDEYNITGSVTFTAQSAQGITIPATSTLASDIGPEFVLNCNYSYIPASMTIYALNETATDTQKAGSVFVRNERAVLPFEGYVSSSASSISASPSYYRIDNNMPATRSNRPLGPVPTIEDM